MSIYATASPSVKLTLVSAVTTGSSSPVLPSPLIQEHAIYIRGNGVISAGAVQIETASDPAYSGTWAPQGSPVTVTAGENIVNITGKLDALRVRVSTVVTGTAGSVDCYYIGN